MRTRRAIEWDGVRRGVNSECRAWLTGASGEKVSGEWRGIVKKCRWSGRAVWWEWKCGVEVEGKLKGLVEIVVEVAGLGGVSRE